MQVAGLSAMMGVTAWEGMAVGLWDRLGVTAAVPLGLGTGLWAVLNTAGADPGLPPGWPAVLATLGVPGRPGPATAARRAQQVGAVVSGSASGMAAGHAGASVFGPDSDFSGPRSPSVPAQLARLRPREMTAALRRFGRQWSGLLAGGWWGRSRRSRSAAFLSSPATIATRAGETE